MTLLMRDQTTPPETIKHDCVWVGNFRPISGFWIIINGGHLTAQDWFDGLSICCICAKLPPTTHLFRIDAAIDELLGQAWRWRRWLLLPPCFFYLASAKLLIPNLRVGILHLSGVALWRSQQHAGWVKALVCLSEVRTTRRLGQLKTFFFLF